MTDMPGGREYHDTHISDEGNQDTMHKISKDMMGSLTHTDAEFSNLEREVDDSGANYRMGSRETNSRQREIDNDIRDSIDTGETVKRPDIPMAEYQNRLEQGANALNEAGALSTRAHVRDGMKEAFGNYDLDQRYFNGYE